VGKERLGSGVLSARHTTGLPGSRLG
jgi:hypothetical protein